jgi:hypothetical protein
MGFVSLRLLTESTALHGPGSAIAENAKTRRQGSKLVLMLRKE